MTISSGSAGQAAQAYKTKGITCTEYRNLLTFSEQIRIDKARTNIEGDLLWLSGVVDPDDDASVVGFAGFTYRDLLRTVNASYDAANTNSCFDLQCQEVAMGLVVLDMLGILDDSTRSATILKGIPM